MFNPRNCRGKVRAGFVGVVLVIDMGSNFLGELSHGLGVLWMNPMMNPLSLSRVFMSGIIRCTSVSLIKVKVPSTCLQCTMDHYLRLHCKNAKIVNDRIDLKFVLTGSKIVKLLLITFSIE